MSALAHQSRLTAKYWRSTTKEQLISIGTILLIVVILILIGVLPSWPHARSWGYGPSGIVGVVTGSPDRSVLVGTPVIPRVNRTSRARQRPLVRYVALSASITDLEITSCPRPRSLPTSRRCASARVSISMRTLLLPRMEEQHARRAGGLARGFPQRIGGKEAIREIEVRLRATSVRKCARRSHRSSVRHERLRHSSLSQHT